MKKIISPLTGAVYDLTQSQDLLDAYREVKEFKKTMTALENKIKERMEFLTTVNDEYDLNGLFKVKKQLIQTSTYPISLLRQYFDEDALALICKPVLKSVEEQMANLTPSEQRELRKQKIVEREHYRYIITEA